MDNSSCNEKSPPGAANTGRAIQKNPMEEGDLCPFRLPYQRRFFKWQNASITHPCSPSARTAATRQATPMPQAATTSVIGTSNPSTKSSRPRSSPRRITSPPSVRLRNPGSAHIGRKSSSAPGTITARTSPTSFPATAISPFPKSEHWTSPTISRSPKPQATAPRWSTPSAPSTA